MLNLNFHPFPVLVTNRLRLRAVSTNDAKEILELRADERVMRFIDRPRAKTLDDALELIGKMTVGVASNESISWAISKKASRKLIGTIGFWRVVKENDRAEIGYMLHPDYHGRGFMQEAMTAALQYGFKVMKLHSVEANVNPENIASQKLLQKNGFVLEAHFKENYFFDGKFLDSFIYSLLTPLK